MKKFAIIFILLFLFQTGFAVENEFYGTGISVLKDTYSKRTYIFEILPESPAEKYGLKQGAEIIEINEIKTKKLSEKEITDKLNDKNEIAVNLLIKEKRKKNLYNLPLKNLSVPPEKKQSKTFNLHWKQVVPEKYENANYIPDAISDKVSGNFYANVVQPQNYWYKRKQNFTIGYEACMSYSASVKDNCLMNLVNREIAQTNNDRNVRLQKELIFQQEIQNSNLQQQNFELQRLNNNYPRRK